MGKIAFVFPGQGAQSIGMGQDLYNHVASAKDVFDRAGTKIRSLCFTGPEKQLNLTINTQPCLFTANLACARALNEYGIYAQGVAGFSLGEISALAYAGVLKDETAGDFVALRAHAMEQCAQATKGTMVAVLGPGTRQVENICSKLSDVYPVNYNCPGQTVVACGEQMLPALRASVTEAKGKAVPLKVGGAFHSPLMDKAADKVQKYLDKAPLDTGAIPVYANVTGRPYGDPKTLLSQQVKRPVLWHKTIENMIADGFETFIEVGPGKILSGLIRKIDSTVKIYRVSDMATLQNTVAGVNHAKR